ncbi:MAG: hypothetical protein NT147_02320 [Candidatus Aminicenantes bacterium]|nr:hypothetical protein [Candidatus Aminicenantes bacterium]
MKTHRTLICLALVGVATLVPSLFSAEKIIQSQWAAVPVRIDGANQEWQDAAILVDKVSRAEYALRNDDKYLYILFVFKVYDLRVGERVQKVASLSTYEVSGMKVYVSFDGKKDKSNGFHFVKKTITADELIANLEKNGETLTDEKKAGIRQQKAYMVYEGMPLDPAKPVPPVASGQADPPTFRDQLKRELSVVEFRIPLAYLAQAGAAAAPGANLKLGFEWGGMTKEMRSAYMARMADSGARASQGDVKSTGEDNKWAAREGGGGEGGPMGGQPNRDTKKYDFWIDVQLANKVS